MRTLMLLCLVLYTGCAGCATHTARDTALHMQTHGNFMPQRFDAGHFVLFGLLRPGTQTATLHVYIEGDGFAWVSRTHASANPTPEQPIALRLAQADPSPAPVLYLARPCQYVNGVDARHCTARYWTDARFASKVVESMNVAISKAKENIGAHRVALTGYSGGGAIATLIAAQREDVAFLGTIAGTLDHVAWTSLHRVSPLHASLNPLDVAHRLRDMPQRHMSSRADTVMPPSISKTFCERTGQPQTCVVVSGIAHNGTPLSWEQVWEY